MQRKQEIAKEYIQEKILNKDLLEIQNSLNELKTVVSSQKEEKQKDDIFWLESTLNILFNDKWKQRNKLWYEINKLKTINYHMMSGESQSNLDLLYNELQEAESKDELKSSLWMELNHLKQQIEWGKTEQKEKLENIENFTVDEQYIYNQAKLYWVTDRRQVSYILATVKWECGFKNIKEKWWEDKRYWKNWFYGRWFVQLTHKGNYRNFTKIIENSWLNFKDNNWNVLTKEKLDLIQNPDTITNSNDLAAFILIYWMKNWSFTWKKLSDFINDEKTDFYNARKIVNWKDKAAIFEKEATEYLSKMEKNNKNKQILAENTSETIIYWDSHVWWISLSWYTGTTEHNNWYNTKQLYENISNLNLDGKKSLILYTWSNDITKKTIWSMSKYLKDIKKYLDTKNVQLVLSTIPYNKSKQKKETDKINKIITDFADKNKLPLLDFHKNITLASNDYADDWIHLNTKWYREVSKHIENQFA